MMMSLSAWVGIEGCLLLVNRRLIHFCTYGLLTRYVCCEQGLLLKFQFFKLAANQRHCLMNSYGEEEDSMPTFRNLSSLPGSSC